MELDWCKGLQKGRKERSQAIAIAEYRRLQDGQQNFNIAYLHSEKSVREARLSSIQKHSSFFTPCGQSIKVLYMELNI